jgi:hypothetical protein
MGNYIAQENPFSDSDDEHDHEHDDYDEMFDDESSVDDEEVQAYVSRFPFPWGHN